MVSDEIEIIPGVESEAKKDVFTNEQQEALSELIKKMISEHTIKPSVESPSLTEKVDAVEVPRKHLDHPIETVKTGYFKLANEYNEMHPFAKIVTWPLAIATICLALYAGSAFMNAKGPIKKPTMFEQGAPIVPTQIEQPQEKKQDLNIKINFNVPYNR